MPAPRPIQRATVSPTDSASFKAGIKTTVRERKVDIGRDVGHWSGVLQPISTSFPLHNPPARPIFPLAMPSFDIVSEVNPMEIQNAVNQANKELANRFDFKGSKVEITLEKNEIKLAAEDQFKIKALEEIVLSKLAKRQVSLKSIDKGEPDISPLGHARQALKIKQGIEGPVAKQITSFIRDSKLKVTTQIMGDQIRVTGKSKDDLQSVIASLRAKDFPTALSFQNFRD
jgi:uncharacterized protein YajQ (UPF0234 family)